ncbi:hypothetical protein J2S74_005447 [Evansella vedderi]|uniref:Uncharacterized protein n=1 Tax=Evansella vedderi TaxID=38282 RepID=A0ABU0A3B0_9BACI|nr:hypothetical protein [Evansella vedderi]
MSLTVGMLITSVLGVCLVDYKKRGPTPSVLTLYNTVAQARKGGKLL